MPSYTNPFTGQTISPSQVGYESLTISANTELQWPINGNNTQVVANIIDVTATVASLELIMPPATQVSVGQSVLVNNIGSFTFTVTDNSGNTIAAIASGIAEYIYVTDNTTIDGTWATVTFGAGTSSANASALAGYGLKAIGTTLNQAYNVVSYFSDNTLGEANRAQFAVWESGVGTLTLPSSSVVGNNWFCMIRNSGSGILTVAPTGTDTIDGNINAQLQLTDSFVVASNGVSGFSTFALGRSNVFAYTQLAKTVTGGTVTLTSAEYTNTIQEYYGALTSDCYVVLPSTVQLYSLRNLTTGSYNLTFKTSSVGAATVTLPQNQTLIVVCDGTNVYNAASAAGGTVSSITLDPGSAANPSLNFTGDSNTGIYQPATGQIGFSLNGTNTFNLDAAGSTLGSDLAITGDGSVTGTFTAIGGISGGTF